MIIKVLDHQRNERVSATTNTSMRRKGKAIGYDKAMLVVGISIIPNTAFAPFTSAEHRSSSEKPLTIIASTPTPMRRQ
jgi:hypothetical protein